MEHATQACEVGVKWEIEAADNYGKYGHLIPLCYAMLYYALQEAVPELSIVAKPRQPNRYNDQIALVDPSEGYE